MPGLLGATYARGWLVLPVTAMVAAAIFGQVTINDTMTARYISPALRTRMYSVRFFVGFFGAAAAAPLVAGLHGAVERVDGARRVGKRAAARRSVMAGLRKTHVGARLSGASSLSVCPAGGAI